MIVLLRPEGVPAADYDQWRHGWTLQARRAGELVTELLWTPASELAAFDRINVTPGRTVWATPAFIPAPSFFDELDVIAGEKFPLVVLKRYEVVFQPGDLKPAIVTEDGVSGALLVAQLYARKKAVLPSSAGIESPWKFAAKNSKRNPFTYRVPQRWVDLAFRSILGTTYLNPWNGAMGCVGRVLTGEMYWYDKEEQAKRWREAVAGWIQFERRR